MRSSAPGIPREQSTFFKSRRTVYRSDLGTDPGLQRAILQMYGDHLKGLSTRLSIFILQAAQLLRQRQMRLSGFQALLCCFALLLGRQTFPKKKKYISIWVSISKYGDPYRNGVENENLRMEMSLRSASSTCPHSGSNADATWLTTVRDYHVCRGIIAQVFRHVLYREA